MFIDTWGPIHDDLEARLKEIDTAAAEIENYLRSMESGSWGEIKASTEAGAQIKDSIVEAGDTVAETLAETGYEFGDRAAQQMMPVADAIANSIREVLTSLPFAPPSAPQQKPVDSGMMIPN